MARWPRVSLRSLAGAAGLLGLAIAAACGAPPPVRAPAGEHLIAIRIAGNRAIESDALEPALALHEAISDGAAVDPYLLAADTERIRAAYIKRGFFAVKVTSEVLHGQTTQVVVFTVVEGPRATARVEITGLPPGLSPAAARALVAIEDGAPFDYDAYDAAKQPLTALLENAGYARAEIRGTVIADPAVATLRYEIVPGVRCTFGEIRITGAGGELEDAVRARLRLATGARYSGSALAASQTEIYDLGRFSSVEVTADRSGGGAVVPVGVAVREADRREVHAGFGVGADPVHFEARVRGGGSWVPESAPLVTTAAEARVAATIPREDLTKLETGNAEPKIRVIGSLQRTDLWWPRLRGEIEGGYDYQTVEAYTWRGLHVRLGLGSPLGPRWLQLRVGWLLEELFFKGIKGAIAPSASVDTDTCDTACMARSALGLSGPQRLGAYQASLVADLRDDPIEPHRGAYLAVTAAKGTRWAGGALDYWQITPELRYYYSIAGTVMAARVRVGQIIGDVPVTERYYSGGISGQRGFPERQLAPRVALDPTGCASTGQDPIVIGGAGLIETGIELRRQITTVFGYPVGANLFLDGADVTCDADAIDPRHLQWAAGTGIWVKVPGLKIQGDIGYRLNRKGVDELPDQGVALLLGIGETF